VKHVLSAAQIHRTSKVRGSRPGGAGKEERRRRSVLAETASPQAQSRSGYPNDPKRLAWCESAARRIRIVPVTITFTNSAISPVNEQFATLIARDFAGGTNCFGLSIGARCYARTAFGTNRPLSVAWNYVLIWHIFFTSFQ